jgi:hypothetical protein
LVRHRKIPTGTFTAITKPFPWAVVCEAETRKVTTWESATIISDLVVGACQGLPQPDQRRLSRLSPGDQLGLLSDGQAKIVGIAVQQGGLSTGPHLHFEQKSAAFCDSILRMNRRRVQVYQRGMPQNPASFDPGTASAIASTGMSPKDRQWFERYRVFEGASLAQLPHQAYPSSDDEIWLTGFGGPDEEMDIDAQ